MDLEKILSFVRLFGLIYGVEINSLKYFKVQSKLPNPNKFCAIGSQPNPLGMKFDCLCQCHDIAECSLVCADDKECRYFKSKISPYYNLSRYPEVTSQPMTGFTCYSSYFFPNDITGNIINVTGIEGKKGQVLKNAVSGFSCINTGTNSLYASSHKHNPWIQVEFDSIYLIKKVMVQTRLRPNYPTHFEKVEIRVGNSSGIDGNFSSQTFFTYYEGMAENGEFVTVEPENSVRGKYLSLQTMHDNGNLIIQDLKIFN